MFEVDEGFAPFAAVGTQEFRPSGDVGRLVVLAAQTQIAEVRCRDGGRGELLAFSEAEGRIMRAKAFENLFLEPGIVAKFEGGAETARQLLRKAFKTCVSFLNEGGNWKSSGPSLCSKPG